jgi:hypothetical protein
MEKIMDMSTATVGSLIDKLEKVREERRVLAEKDKELAAKYGELEVELMQRLDADGTQKASSKKATVSISETVVGNVVDWELAWKLISKNPQLMQRRISDPAFRELCEQKGEKFMAKYGMTPFVKRRLNLRSL